MIAIPNMDKPSCCGKCILQDGEMCFAIDDGGDGLSLFSLEDLRDFCIKRRDDCPLIEIVQCKDCKWFELDVWGKLNGIPVIVAHEMCDFWGGGCKTNPNGFCSYGEREGE